MLVYCLQTYTAVTDARNSDAYAYALNYEYLMASVRSSSPCVSFGNTATYI